VLLPLLIPSHLSPLSRSNWQFYHHFRFYLILLILGQPLLWAVCPAPWRRDQMSVFYQWVISYCSYIVQTTYQGTPYLPLFVSCSSRIRLDPHRCRPRLGVAALELSFGNCFGPRGQIGRLFYCWDWSIFGFDHFGVNCP